MQFKVKIKLFAKLIAVIIRRQTQNCTLQFLFGNLLLLIRKFNSHRYCFVSGLVEIKREFFLDAVCVKNNVAVSGTPNDAGNYYD